jgi:hypothetical protein
VYFISFTSTISGLFIEHVMERLKSQTLFDKYISLCTVSTTESFVKQNNDTNKTCKHVHDLSLLQISFDKLTRFMGCHCKNYEF